MTSPVDQIKDRLDIVELINGYVRLKKAGARWTGLCPFHTEKTPSFTVTQEKQMWYCFGCSQGGDLFTFVEKIEGVEFADALRLLADKAGVKLERDNPKLRSQRRELYEVVEEAAKFFSRQLESKIGKAVVAYLHERGLSDDSIEVWRLGYSPDNWRALHDYLAGKGYADAALEAAGLTIKSHDRFRHRIMFPIFDVQGQVIGFSGRIFDKIKSTTVGDETGKYINTPKTLIYDKSRVLYGLDRAKSHIRAADSVIIIEGNLDLILAHQAGTRNAAAVFGTALTESQLSLVRRYTTNLTLCFDSDEAGERATRRAALAALTKKLDVSVIPLPAGQDAADLISSNEPRWPKIIASPIPFVEFTLQRARERFSPQTLAGKKAITADILPILAQLPSALEQEYWVKELAITIGSSEQVLKEELRKVRVLEESSGGPETNIPEPEPSAQSILEEYLLVLAAAYPETKAALPEVLELVESAEIREVLSQYLAGGDLGELLCSSERFLLLLARAAFIEELVDDGRAEMARIISELHRRSLKEKLKALEVGLREAERSKDEQKTQALLEQFTSLSRELTNYEKKKTQEI